MRESFISILFFGFFFLTLIPAIAQWDPIGLDISTDRAIHKRMAIDEKNDLVYVVYYDVSGHQGLSVQVYDGNSWSYVGPQSFTSKTSAIFDIAILDGVPYLMHISVESGVTSQFFKFNGVEWEELDSDAFDSMVEIHFEVYEDELYVGTIDRISRKLSVRKYVSDQWEYIGTENFSLYDAVNFDITIYDGMPYVSISEHRGQEKLGTIMKFDGLEWGYVGMPHLDYNDAAYTSIRLDSNGTPFVLFNSFHDTTSVNIYKYENASWTETTSATQFYDHFTWSSLRINDCDEPFLLTYKDGEAFVYKYDGLEWQGINTSNYLDNLPTGPVMELHGCNIYLTYADFSTTPSKLDVIKYAPILEFDNLSQDLMIECSADNTTEIIEDWLEDNGGASAVSEFCEELEWYHDFDINDIQYDCGLSYKSDVNFFVSDKCGNAHSTQASIIVEDNKPPELIELSKELIVSNVADIDNIIRDWLANNGGAVATEDCGSMSWSHNYTNLTTGDCSNPNPTQVVFSVMDDCGNQAISIADIVVTESLINCEIFFEGELCDLSSLEATVLVVDGTEPYFYEWNTGETENVINDLQEGTYSVTVNDVNGCTTSCFLDLEIPKELYCNILTTDALCGLDIGVAMVEVIEGMPPFNYNWSNGETSLEITDLSAGMYGVTVTDSNGCSTSCEAEVIEDSNCIDPGTCNDGDCTNGEEVWDCEICDCVVVQTIEGCTNPNALNYNTEANCEDGSCIDEINIYIPNVLSLSDNSVNNSIILFSSTDVEFVSFSLYDRWGNLVVSNISNLMSREHILWEPINPQLNDGVYVYKINYKIGTLTDEITGDITFLR